MSKITDCHGIQLFHGDKVETIEKVEKKNKSIPIGTPLILKGIGVNLNHLISDYNSEQWEIDAKKVKKI